jgi:hypothetical protein
VTLVREEWKKPKQGKFITVLKEAKQGKRHGKQACRVSVSD